MIESFKNREIKEAVTEIEKKILENVRRNRLDVSEIRNLVEDYRKLGFVIQKLIEYAGKNAEGDLKIKLEKIYEEISPQNISTLCDRLRSYGFTLRDKEVYERFYDKEKKVPQGVVYRILELTRLGKRDEVFYIILREFATVGKEVGKELIQAFNPKYSLESFKTLIYSFLSGLLGETKGKDTIEEGVE